MVKSEELGYLENNGYKGSKIEEENLVHQRQFATLHCKERNIYLRVLSLDL